MWGKNKQLKLFFYRNIKSNSNTRLQAFVKSLLTRLVPIICVLFFHINKVEAQNEKTYPTYINAMYTSGHISKHSQNVSHLSRGFTNGVDIIASNLIPIRTKMDDRPKLVYLDLGIHYINYPMDFLGQSIAVTIGRSGRVAQLGKFQLLGQFMTGLGYCSDPFTQENNKNNVMSTHVGFHINGSLSGIYPIYKNWNALLGVAYSHLSNAATQKPNSGYNVMSLNAGVSYHIQDKVINDSFEYYTSTRKYYYHLLGTYFPVPSGSYSDEKFPCYNFHAQLERNLSIHHSLLLSLDYSNNQKEVYPSREKPEDASSNNHNYFGASIGGNWKYSFIDLSVTNGFYFLKPWNVSNINYTLVHFKFYALKNKYFALGVKAEGVTAINFEAGIGVKL